MHWHVLGYAQFALCLFSASGTRNPETDEAQSSRVPAQGDEKEAVSLARLQPRREISTRLAIRGFLKENLCRNSSTGSRAERYFITE